MKQSIHVSGMTCNSCLAIVSRSIYNLEEVKDLKIDLKSGNIKLNVSSELNLGQIKKVLPLKYTPSIIFKPKNHISIVSDSKIKQLFPLFLIFIYLIAGTLFLQSDNFNFPKLMFDFMGLFFIVFSFFKFLDFNGFTPVFAKYDPIAKRSLIYGKIYPFIETSLGIMYLFGWQINTALIITCIILSITTIGIINIILDKDKIDCACLGTAIKLPMTEATLIENVIMLVMAVSMIFYQFS